MSLLFITIVLAIPALLSWPVGKAMKWAMDPDEPLKGLRGRFTALFRGVSGGLIEKEQDWKAYSLSLLLFNAVMFEAVFAIMETQQYLPLNPDAKGALEPSTIFNTAASFVTNTNLQHYSGEVSMSYLSQLFALMWLQFVSAATGIAALTALSRGLSGKPKLGNFYRDLLNAALLVLLPIAIVDATLLVLGGVPMTFHGAASAETLEGVTQTIARGPVAAFVAIKQLGTNGGGWFGPNSTHPFENPTFFTNIVESVDIVLLAMSSVWMFGRITKRMRHAAVIFAAMAFMLVCLVGAAVYFESAPTQAFTGLPVEHSMNLEGKELRFGSSAGPLWATITTNTSNGSVDAEGADHIRALDAHRARPAHGYVAQHDLRWCRSGFCKYVHLHYCRCIHMRHDGGEDARIPDEEGGDEGNETRSPRAASPSVSHPTGHGYFLHDTVGGVDRAQSGRARFLRDFVRVQLRCSQ